MSKFGVMMSGPAGAGKSTFCRALIEHLQNNRRSTFHVNLDPAATQFDQPPDLDIKELISLQDVMEELGLGPNGGLVYCLEFLLDNTEFLTEALEGLTEDYLVIFDLPGQIELYTHVPVLPRLVRELTRPGSIDMRLCVVYLLESTFVADRSKFFAGTLSAMSAMHMLEVPHLNVLSKMDLVRKEVRKSDIRRFLDADPDLLDDDPAERARTAAARGGGDDDDDDGMGDADVREKKMVMGGGSFRRLNRAVAGLIESYSLVKFLKLEAGDEDSVGGILSHIDDVIQFHEAQEPRDPKDEEFAGLEAEN